MQTRFLQDGSLLCAREGAPSVVFTPEEVERLRAILKDGQVDQMVSSHLAQFILPGLPPYE